MRTGWLGLSIGLHLAAGAGLVIAPYFQFETLDRPSLDRKDVVIIGALAAPPLRGNGQHAPDTVKNVKPPPTTNPVLKVPQIQQVKPETPMLSTDITAQIKSDGTGLGNDPNGTDNGVLNGKGTNDSIGTNPEGRDSIGVPGMPETFRSFEMNDPPKIVYREAPGYPEVARQQGIEGSVDLRVVIDEFGRVVDVILVRSDNPVLNASAIASVRRWRYTAGRMDGRAVRTINPVRIQFTLHG